MKLDTRQISVLMAERSMTQVELSTSCGIRPQNISTIIHRGTCSPKSAGALAKGLGVSVAEILRAE